MRLRETKIRTTLHKIAGDRGEIGGWLKGKHTYLWFGVNGACQGTLGGPRLLRLAKAIVRHMEGAEHGA